MHASLLISIYTTMLNFQRFLMKEEFYKRYQDGDILSLKNEDWKWLENKPGTAVDVVSNDKYANKNVAKKFNCRWKQFEMCFDAMFLEFYFHF